VQYIETAPGRLQLWLQRLGVQIDVADFMGQSGLLGLSDALGMPGLPVALGLMPPLATQMADDLAWLADVAGRRQPYAALVHCLCGAP
jgi:protease-4